MKLSGTEEKLMELIWKLGQPFMKEILAEHPEPKPAKTTVATLLKRMQEKGFITYETFGNSRRYKPLISKDSYFSGQFKGIIKNYFENSALQFASFFTKGDHMSASELEELKKIVDGELNKRNQ